MGYRTVVVGSDGSDTATDAVRHAARLAAAFDATLVVVTAFVPGGAREGGHDVPADMAWRLTDRGQADETVRRARQLAREAGVGEVVPVSAEGDAAGALIDAATSRDADLIVVGSKGMTSPSRFVLGSVANTVSHHAPCDVLVVHTAP